MTTHEMATASDKPVKAEFRILFVDDEAPILASLRRMMRKYPYNCFFAENAQAGLEILESHPIDLIVSDMRMPVMDGAAFLAEVKQRWPFSVRFLMTGYADMNAAINALNLGGINRYISKPWDEQALIEAIDEGLRIRRLEREKKRLLDKTRQQNEELKRFNEELESRVNERTQEIQHKSALLKTALKQLESSYDASARVFATIINSRPLLQKGQSRHVADLAKAIAERMSLGRSDIAYIYYAALLHELGKLNLPDDILMRAEANLTHRDIEVYQKYPEMGEMFLTAITALAPSARLIRHHTELFDGSGFPDGQRGQSIEPGARIIRVARDFIGLQSGLMSNSPYSKEQAYRYIEEHAGRRYDPEVVEHLRPLIDSFSVEISGDQEQRVAVAALRPGMVLSRDLVNKSGILLMAAGSKLNEHVINKLLQIERLEGRRVSVCIAEHHEEE